MTAILKFEPAAHARRGKENEATSPAALPTNCRLKTSFMTGTPLSSLQVLHAARTSTEAGSSAHCRCALEPPTVRGLRATPCISKVRCGTPEEGPTLASVLRSWLEGYLDSRLKDTRTTDAVNVADAAAQGARNFTEIASKRRIR